MYQFIDTNELQGIDTLPSEALKINGQWIEEQIPGYRTLNVSGREMLSNEIADLQVGSADGRRYLHKRYEPRTITVTYQLIASSNSAFRDAYNKLNALLDVEEAHLIFKDEEDKYFIGTRSGFSDVTPGVNSVTGEIEFYCADPFKYSVKEFEVSPTLDGGTTFAVDYKGTYKAFPVIEARMNGDNGFLGFMNANGAILQFGNVDEVDGVNYLRSESMIAIGDGQMNATALAGFQQNVATLLPVQLSGLGTSGIISSASVVTFHGNTENVALLSSRGSGGDSRWKGASITKAIGTDSEGRTTAKNFHAVIKHVFMLGAPYQQGATEFLITTKDKKNIAGIIFVKNNLADKCNVYFCVNGEIVGSTVTSAHAWASINPYMTWDVGHHSITKSGNTITFYFGTKNYVYRIPVVENMEAYEVSFYIGSLDGYDSVTHQAIRGVTFRKDNVEKYRDVPNKFGPGDIFVVETCEGRVTLDKMLAPGLGALGNDWEKFYLKPGSNQIKCICSGWAKKPDFKLKYREVYL